MSTFILLLNLKKSKAFTKEKLNNFGPIHSPSPTSSTAHSPCLLPPMATSVGHCDAAGRLIREVQQCTDELDSFFILLFFLKYNKWGGLFSISSTTPHTPPARLSSSPASSSSNPPCQPSSGL